jgi:hypothetical protein
MSCKSEDLTSASPLAVALSQRGAWKANARAPGTWGILQCAFRDFCLRGEALERSRVRIPPFEDAPPYDCAEAGCPVATEALSSYDAGPSHTGKLPSSSSEELRLPNEPADMTLIEQSNHRASCAKGPVRIEPRRARAPRCSLAVGPGAWRGRGGSSGARGGVRGPAGRRRRTPDRGFGSNCRTRASRGGRARDRRACGTLGRPVERCQPISQRDFFAAVSRSQSSRTQRGIFSHDVMAPLVAIQGI